MPELVAQKLTTIRLYAFALAGMWVGIVVWSAHVEGTGRWDAIVLLAVVANIAEGRHMRLSPQVAVSVSFMPMALAAVLFGPVAAGIVGAVAMASWEAPAERFLIYLSGKGLAGCAAGWAAVAASGSFGSGSVEQLVVVAGAASVVGTSVEFGVAAMTLLLRHGSRPSELWRLLRGSLAVSVALYAPVTALIAFVYGSIGLRVLLFFIVPLVAAHLSFEMHARQAQLIEELEESNDRLEGANSHLRRVNISFAAAMVRALESRDAYTAGHSAAVAVYARDIAREMGMPDDDVERVHLTGLVHDIGKIGLRAEVLGKRSALDDEEWAEMRRHSEIGARILAEVEDYADVAAIVRSHHERWDGAGYPDGLSGETIPLLARVIAVADSYNAMTSDRPYRAAMTTDHAIRQLILGKGSQFESDLVDAFLAVLARETEAYCRGDRSLDDFTIEAARHGALGPDAGAAATAAWRAAVA
jgi:putative nucleotidyltransferase with HDIG domain